MTRREMAGWGFLGAFGALAGASGSGASEEGDLEQSCQREVLELHEFFQSWFNATLEPTDTSFDRFASVIDRDFVIISPGGTMTPRAPLLERLRSAHGAWQDSGGGKIWIENYRLHRDFNEHAVVTYEEWQEVRGEVRARLSTGFFGRRQGTPNAVVWLHLHEVWMPSPDRSEG